MAEASATVPGFVSLADRLRPAPTPAPFDAQVAGACDALPAPHASHEPVHEPCSCADAALAEEAARLRLRVVESFERARERLLRQFADDVLARELALAPPDIALLAERALSAFALDDPRALSVAPCDVRRLGPETGIRIQADAELQTGDVVLHVRDGRLASPLRLRAERAIAELLAEASIA